MSEFISPIQPAEEFKAIVNNGDFSSDIISRLEYLANHVEVIEYFAGSYWKLKQKEDNASRDELNMILNHPDMRAGRVLIGALPHVAEVPAKILMIDEYGFSIEDFEGLENEDVVRMCLELVGLVASSYPNEAVAEEFRRKMPEIGNNSRLDLVKKKRIGRARRKAGVL